MKFAQVGYGSEGQGAGKEGEGYTYIVSDNVRTGDKINPVVKHAKNGAIFVTTGQVLSRRAYNKGELIDTEKGETLTTDDLTKAYTGKELGIGRTRGIGGKFEKDKSYHDENGEYVAGKHEVLTRGAGLERFMEQAQEKGGSPTMSQGKATQKAYETYAEYMARTQRVKENK